MESEILFFFCWCFFLSRYFCEFRGRKFHLGMIYCLCIFLIIKSRLRALHLTSLLCVLTILNLWKFSKQLIDCSRDFCCNCSHFWIENVFFFFKFVWIMFFYRLQYLLLVNNVSANIFVVRCSISIFRDFV